jgi:hypothetical protein
MTTYEDLRSIGLTLEEKNGYNYAAWNEAWGRVLEYDPDASFEVHEFPTEPHTDASGHALVSNGEPLMKTSRVDNDGFVQVSTTIRGTTRTAYLAVMNYRNQFIEEEDRDATDINNAVQRCLVKSIALHGLGLWVWSGAKKPPKEERFGVSEKRKLAQARKSKHRDDVVDVYRENPDADYHELLALIDELPDAEE